MPDLSGITNQWLLAAVLVTLLLIGGAGGGWIISFRKDQRAAKREDVDLTEQIVRIANEQMIGLRTEVVDLRERVEGLERELNRAYTVIRAAVGFVHTLLAYIALHLPDRADVPEIPSMLNEYINASTMPFGRAGSSNLYREATN